MIGNTAALSTSNFTTAEDMFTMSISSSNQSTASATLEGPVAMVESLYREVTRQMDEVKDDFVQSEFKLTEDQENLALTAFAVGLHSLAEEYFFGRRRKPVLGLFAQEDGAVRLIIDSSERNERRYVDVFPDLSIRAFVVVGDQVIAEQRSNGF